MSKTFTEKPSVSIDYLVHQKIMHWVQNTDKEISGLGKIINDNGKLKVIEAMLLPQRNTASSTDIEPEDVGKAMFELKDTPGELRWWWHSHVNMGVFWSGTDDDTMEKLSTPGWFVHSVFNKQWQVRTAIQYGKPFPYRIDEIPLLVNHPNISADLRAVWDQEVIKNVTNVTQFRHARRTHLTTQGTIKYWDAALGEFVEKSYGNKRERKSIKRLVREAGGVVADDLRVLKPDKKKGCILCNYHYACKCDPEEKERAHDLDELGHCFVCACMIDLCECSDQDLQDYLSVVVPENAPGLPKHEIELPRKRSVAKGPPAGPPPGVPSVGVG